MKTLASILILMWSFIAQASDVLLIPVHTPLPMYPDELAAAGTSGSVRVRFHVQPDGSVTNINVEQSTHVQFTEAVALALQKWRYKPLPVTKVSRPYLEVILPVEFSPHGPGRMPDDINTRLLSLSCRELNEAMHRREQNYPDHPLNHMDIFWDTSGYLYGKYMRMHLSDAERKVLLDELEAAQPKIVESCRKKPDTKYADYLPQKLRELM